MENRFHDEPNRCPASQQEYSNAIAELRDFQAHIGRQQAKQTESTITLDSIEAAWAYSRDKLGYQLDPKQIDWLIARIHELENQKYTPHSQIAAAIRKGELTGLGWALEVQLADWLNANQQEHNELAEAIERYDEQGHSPFKWELYLDTAED